MVYTHPIHHLRTIYSIQYIMCYIPWYTACNIAPLIFNPRQLHHPVHPRPGLISDSRVPLAGPCHASQCLQPSCESQRWLRAHTHNHAHTRARARARARIHDYLRRLGLDTGWIKLMVMSKLWILHHFALLQVDLHNIGQSHGGLPDVALLLYRESKRV